MTQNFAADAGPCPTWRHRLLQSTLPTASTSAGASEAEHRFGGDTSAE